MSTSRDLEQRLVERTDERHGPLDKLCDLVEQTFALDEHVARLKRALQA